MKQHKIIDYIDSFSQKDWTKFIRFCDFKLSKQSSKRQLFKSLNEALREKTLNAHLLMELHRILKPKLSIKSYQNWLSEACQTIEHYFIWEQLNSSEESRRLLLMQAFNKRALHHSGNKFFAKKDIKETICDQGVFWHHKMMHDYYYSDNPLKQASISEWFEKVIKGFLNQVSFLSQLYSAEAANLSRFYPDRFKASIEKFNAISSIINTKNEILSLLRPMLQGDEQSYNKLKEQVLTPVVEASPTTLFVALSYMIKYLYSSPLTQEEKINEVFRLYRFGIEHELFTLNGVMPLIRFHNTVDIASAAKQWEWLDSFLLEVKNKLDLKHRENSLKLAEAQYCFALNKPLKYEEILSLLRDIKFKDVRQELRSRILICISFYERQRIEESAISVARIQNNNLKRYLEDKQDRLSANEFITYKNFTKAYTLLTNKRQNKKAIQTFCDQNHIFYKSWVSRKKNELV